MTVYNPAQITKQPASEDVPPGSNTSFAVTATGTAISYQWYFDGIPLTDGGQISGSATPTLAISDIQSNNFGSYTVLVSNLLSSTNSQPAYLTAPSVHYVNLNNPTPASPYWTWGTAATNMQNAIDVSVNGDTVLVTNGVYRVGGETINGHGLTNRVAINKAITVQSVNGPAATVIQGFSPLPLGGSTAIRCVYITNNAALIGFTLTGGATLDYANNIYECSGGGIWCESDNATISNCVITGNWAVYAGGGDYQGTLLNCTVSQNSILPVYNGYAYGGGIYQSILDNCMVISNSISSYPYAAYGGGAYNSDLTNCAVADNSTPIVIGNSAGGGAYQGTLVNCTITGNSSQYGGGTFNSTMTNCINYFNTANTAYSYSNYDGGILSYCCTTPLPYGSGNITNDPALASISHISLNSPCRGAGDPAVTSGVDIDGNPWANPPSIGCSEPNPGNDFGPLTIGILTAITNLAPGFPENFQANISGPVYANTWNFGDGTMVTNEVYVSHTWSTTGVYPVTLTAYNDSYPTGQVFTLMVNVFQPSVYYVNLNNANPLPPYLSWNTAAINIQDAVDVANAGSVIWVTNGPTPGYSNNIAVYAYGGAITVGYISNRVAVTKPVTIQSVNGPTVTWIQGSPSGNQVRCVYLTNGATLSGFTVANGFTDEADGNQYDPEGGGVLCASTNAVITNCLIVNCYSVLGGGVYSGTLYNSIIKTNFAVSTGGGVYMSVVNGCVLSWNTGGAAAYSTLDNCTISNNANPGLGGGAYVCVLNNCVLANNSAHMGGGAYDSSLQNCTLGNNSAIYGGGAYGDNQNLILLTNCILKNNTAQYGGGVAGDTSPLNCVLYNCILSSNSASREGGGAYFAVLDNCLVVSNAVANAGNPGGGIFRGVIDNCTVVANVADNGGGISSCLASNSIVYGNFIYSTGVQITSNYDSGSTLKYCCTAPLPPGFGNITNAPLFVNQAGGNFHLQSNSPCINAGNNAGVTTATDLDGNPRIVGGTVDIGAYEYQTPTSVISYAYLQQYGLPTDGSVDYADLDGTGFNVYQDWIAGLNPTNPASVLIMLPVTTTNTTSGIKVTWQSVSGILYNLQRATNLPAQPPFSTIQSNITGQAGTTSYTDTSATNGTPYFYRVGVP